MSFWNLFMQGSRIKVVQKSVQNALKIEKSQFLHSLGHSEETLENKIRKFLFTKRAADLIISSKAFESFYLYNFSISKFFSLK